MGERKLVMKNYLMVAAALLVAGSSMAQAKDYSHYDPGAKGSSTGCVRVPALMGGWTRTASYRRDPATGQMELQLLDVTIQKDPLYKFVGPLLGAAVNGAGIGYAGHAIGAGLEKSGTVVQACATATTTGGNIPTPGKP